MKQTATFLEGSIGEFVRYIAPTLVDSRHCPGWPPDVFAIMASVLYQSGAYFRVVEVVAADASSLVDGEWPERTKAAGERWRKELSKRWAISDFSDDSVIDSLRGDPERNRLWRRIRRGLRLQLSELCKHDDACSAFLELLAVADEACRGLGTRSQNAEGPDAMLEFAAHELLWRSGNQTLCDRITRSKVRVLPKQHTSQRGLSMRSLSHNLALITEADVDVHWHPPLPNVRRRDGLSLLLLPWPEEEDIKHFGLIPHDRQIPAMSDQHRFFEYRRSKSRPASLARRAEAAVQAALASVANIDAIVLPELALTWDEYLAIERVAVRHRALLIAGVAMPRSVANTPIDQNVCIVQGAGFLGVSRFLEDLRSVRAKNHRWCLDRFQVERYGLTGVLPAMKDSWEYTALAKRKLVFQTTDSWMTLCVQICEDLARQDSVASVIRSIGPNLVIALLMDGPQLRTRWPSRYASIFSDDPGCSVLTLTSLGMTRMSRADSSAEQRGRVIALWRDIDSGEREIELGPEENACVIVLGYSTSQEFTADGRGDGGVTYSPTLTGVHRLSVKTLGAKRRTAKLAARRK